MPEMYDCAVIGLGGFGSSTAFHLARKGASVLGLEQFGAAHDRGSSHGETRIIRKAYFEHPDYVPLLERSYDLVSELEQLCGNQLYDECGLLVSGPASGEVIGGVRLANQLYGVPIEEVADEEVSSRFSGFRPPGDFTTLFEPAAGYLQVEKCVQAHWKLAEKSGAVMLAQTPVKEWKPEAGGFLIRTENEDYHARKLVITAGAWSAELSGDLRVPLQILRKVLLWHPMNKASYARESGGCGFFFEMPYGQFYGFPSIDGGTVKLAEHTGGEQIDHPEKLNRSLKHFDCAPLEKFISEVMPDLEKKSVRHAVCMYTMTPDANFLIDEHPDHPGLYLGAGFSGHGFKFTPVLGEALAELVLEGETRQPVGFLGLGRFK